MTQIKISTGIQPLLNDQKTTTLLSYVENCKKVSGTEQQQIFHTAVRKVKILAPKMDKKLLKQHKEENV